MAMGQHRGQQVRLIGQQGPARFLVDAGRGDALGAVDVQLARIYDSNAGTLGEPLPVDSIVRHSPGWTDLSAPDVLLADVRRIVAMLLAEGRSVVPAYAEPVVPLRSDTPPDTVI